MMPLKIYNHKNFTKDFIIVFFVMLSPFLIYLHLLFPETEVFNFYSITIISGYYENINTMFWVFLMKFTVVIILTLWYITNKHWWKPAILFALFIALTQFFLAMNDEISDIDKYDYWLGPLLALPIIFIVIFISKKLNYYSKSKSLSENLDLEIKLLFQEVSELNVKDYKEVKQTVTKLRHQNICNE